MAYREVGMLEVKEVLRLWLAGQAKKAIARQVGLDPKTVRSYVAAALAAGLVATATEVSEELLTKTLAELRPEGGRPRGDAPPKVHPSRTMQPGGSRVPQSGGRFIFFRSVAYRASPRRPRRSGSYLR
jgi:Bacterial regulatory proteins, luxR family